MIKNILRKYKTKFETKLKSPNKEELLTESEFKAINLLGDFYNLCSKEIVGKEVQDDLSEIAHHVHILQRTIMKQAAARAYPKDFRLLGKKQSDKYKF